MRSKFLSVLAAMALVMSTTACQVKKTQEGELPKVDVKGGQLPKYDVKTPTVEVSSTPVQMKVPEVHVDTENKTVQVPKVNIEPASATPTPTPHR